MPRPGPRPYECVRRAWHSDRHQPIRGSLIKEIFRVANEIHSSSTKQNKEWQEKLPTVVLKAEEIMYSKANSEAEYMDLKTLWDRTNDAINTIIRRDESSETGDFLQPCIEAALNLGCTPRRASRSQRNCHPRCYLSPNTTDLDDAAAKCSSLVRPPNHLGSVLRSPSARNSITAAMKLVCAPENAPKHSYEKLLPISNYATANSSSAAYPLYYGKVPQIKPLCPGPVFLPKPVPDVVWPAKGPVAPPNVPFHEDSPMKSSGGDTRISCDLSLRLGPIPVTFPAQSSVEKNQPKVAVSQGGGKFCCDQLPILDKGFSFFRRGNMLESFGSYKGVESEATMRKRKAGFDQPMMIEDQQYYLQPKLPFRNLTGL